MCKKKYKIKAVQDQLYQNGSTRTGVQEQLHIQEQLYTNSWTCTNPQEQLYKKNKTVTDLQEQLNQKRCTRTAVQEQIWKKKRKRKDICTRTHIQRTDEQEGIYRRVHKRPIHANHHRYYVGTLRPGLCPQVLLLESSQFWAEKRRCALRILQEQMAGIGLKGSVSRKLRPRLLYIIRKLSL